MTTWTWSTLEITTLRTAIASGVLTVSYSGPPARTVTYQSLDAMRRLLTEMISTNNGSDGTRRSYRVGAINKDL